MKYKIVIFNLLPVVLLEEMLLYIMQTKVSKQAYSWHCCQLVLAVAMLSLFKLCS